LTILTTRDAESVEIRGEALSQRWPYVSVVIPTYHRDELLTVCLDGVLEQDYPLQHIEIVVVDDACSPTTPGVIEHVLARHPGAPIALLSGPGRGPAAARNKGWRHACGEIIAFIDDDARPATTGWLSAGLSAFSDPNVNGVSGAIEVPMPNRPTDFQRNVQRLEEGIFLTCNAFYRRAALEAVDGFDERFEVPFREDSDLQYRVEALGGVLLRCPEARVVHPAPRGKFGVSVRLQRYSMYNALLYKKHPQRYRREVQSLPPVKYYAMVMLALLTVLALMRSQRVYALLFFAMWSAFEAKFFAQRVKGTSHSCRDIGDMALSSLVIPPLSIYWRLRGALRFGVWFA
jgi:glycosyltransferase involved in cell wall biosynthesis